jgi:Arm DNA-binding domain
MEKSFGLSFFLKKNKHDRNKKSVIYMRITVNSESMDISTKRKCESKKWNKISGRMNIKEEGSLEFNSIWTLCNKRFLKQKENFLNLIKILVQSISKM